VTYYYADINFTFMVKMKISACVDEREDEKLQQSR
jgi:hypothetical protein